MYKLFSLLGPFICDKENVVLWMRSQVAALELCLSRTLQKLVKLPFFLSQKIFTFAFYFFFSNRFFFRFDKKIYWHCKLKFPNTSPSSFMNKSPPLNRGIDKRVEFLVCRFGCWVGEFQGTLTEWKAQYGWPPHGLNDQKQPVRARRSTVLSLSREWFLMPVCRTEMFLPSCHLRYDTNLV